MKLWDEFKVNEVIEFNYKKAGWDLIVRKTENEWIQLDTRFHATDKEPEDWEQTYGTYTKEAFSTQADLYEIVSHGIWQEGPE